MGKRGAFAAQEKLAVVQHVRSTGDVAATVAHFYPLLSGEPAANRRKLVWAWCRDEAKLTALCATRTGAALKKARPTGLTATLSPEIESEIVAWINDLRGDGVPVSSVMLCVEAKRIAAAHDLTSSFEASWWWRKRFLVRHRMALRARTRQGQVSTPELDKIAADFAQLVSEKMAELSISTVHNADQTGWSHVYFPVSSTRIYSCKCNFSLFVVYCSCVFRIFAKADHRYEGRANSLGALWRKE